jgi:chloramphenicol 3-O-phosphotransferase
MLVKRIHLTGHPGSGKTSLARRLASEFAVPHYDLDWVAYTERGARPADERGLDVGRIAAGSGWVTEGAYSGWVRPLLDAADVVLWLDVPWRVCAWRMVKRHALAELQRDNQHPGWRRLFGFIGYTRGYFDLSRAEPGQTTRDAVAAELATLGPKVLRCRSSGEVRAALGRLHSAESAVR